MAKTYKNLGLHAIITKKAVLRPGVGVWLD
jgi:hypothetical protein